MALTEKQRAYERAKYQRNRERILARQRELLFANPERLERRRTYYRDLWRARYHSDPEWRQRRLDSDRRSYMRKHYGTLEPALCQPSVIDGRHYHPRGTRPPCRPPKPPRPPAASASGVTRSRPATPKSKPPTPTRRSSSSRTATTTSRGPAPASTPSTKPSQPPWIPQPVSEWHPSLATEAMRGADW